MTLARLAALGAALALPACASPQGDGARPSGFHPAIDCAGPFLTPEMDPRCAAYRRRLND